MYSRIVVPLDGSDMAAQAVPTAEEFARLSGAPLHLVRVADFGRFGWTGPYGMPAMVLEAEQAAAAEYLADVSQTIAGHGIKVTTEVRIGSSSQQIVEAVQQGDLLVMTSHGRSGPARWFLGSVAEDVVRRSPVPVLLVRVTSSAEAAESPEPVGAETLVQPEEEVLVEHDRVSSRELHGLPVGLGLGLGESTAAEGVLGEFVLADEIAQFIPGESPNERRAETLIKTDRLRVVLVTMREGITLHEHSAPGPITIQTLRGRFGVSVAGEEHEIAEGGLIAIAAGARHAVRTIAEGAFLLTIVWPQAAPGISELVVPS